MRLSTFLAATAATLALATAGAANATQYLLQYSDAFGDSAPGTPFGTVDVTGSATDLHFVINVAPGMIVDTGQHYAVAMKLSGSGFTYVGPSGFSLTQGASLSSSPFSGFNLGLNCNSCGNGASNPYGSSLTFDITGTGLGVLAANNFEGHPINFAVDVVRGGVNTGVIGGGLSGPVPEPSAWALMILGFGGVGAAIRSRRRATLVTA
jgi:hypothetical protein